MLPVYNADVFVVDINFIFIDDVRFFIFIMNLTPTDNTIEYHICFLVSLIVEALMIGNVIN